MTTTITTNIVDIARDRINAYQSLAQKATGAGDAGGRDSRVVAALKQFFYNLDFLLKYGHFPSGEDTAQNALPKELRGLRAFLETPQDAEKSYILQKDINTRYRFTWSDTGHITVAEEVRYSSPAGARTGYACNDKWRENDSQPCEKDELLSSLNGVNQTSAEEPAEVRTSEILNSLNEIKDCLPGYSDSLVFTIGTGMTTCRLPLSLSKELNVDLIIAEDKNKQVAGYLRHKGVDLKLDEETLVSVFRLRVDGNIPCSSSLKLFAWGDKTAISARNFDEFFPPTAEGRQSAITAALNAPCKYISPYAILGEGYMRFNFLYKDLKRIGTTHLFLNGIDVSPLRVQIRDELIKDVDTDNAMSIKQMTTDSVDRLMSCFDERMGLNSSQTNMIRNILLQPQFASAMSAAINQIHGNVALTPIANLFTSSMLELAARASENLKEGWELIPKDELYVYINMNDDAPDKLAVKSTYVRPFLTTEGIGAAAISAIFDVTSDCAEATLETMNQLLKPAITGCIATS